jgi:hypothetical protein
MAVTKMHYADFLEYKERLQKKLDWMISRMETKDAGEASLATYLEKITKEDCLLFPENTKWGWAFRNFKVPSMVKMLEKFNNVFGGEAKHTGQLHIYEYMAFSMIPINPELEELVDAFVAKQQEYEAKEAKFKDTARVVSGGSPVYIKQQQEALDARITADRFRETFLTAAAKEGDRVWKFGLNKKQRVE